MGLPSRRKRNLKINKDIYIFTEGTATEVHYFNALKQLLKNHSMKVVVKGVGSSGQRLITYAANYTRRERNIESVWVVFDKDNLSAFDISNSKKLAEKNNIRIAFSNSSFEVWLLLHFERLFFPSGFDQKSAYSKLAKHLDVRNYEKEKSNMVMIQKIAEKYKTAIANNIQLLEQSKSFENTPYTNMVTLIKSLEV